MKLTLYLISALVIIVVVAQLVLARDVKPATTTAVTWTYTVQHDDTLWQIARRFYPHKDPRETVWDIRVLNGLDTATIKPGQRLRMPAGSTRVEAEE